MKTNASNGGFWSVVGWLVGLWALKVLLKVFTAVWLALQLGQ